MESKDKENAQRLRKGKPPPINLDPRRFQRWSYFLGSRFALRRQQTHRLVLASSFEEKSVGFGSSVDEQFHRRMRRPRLVRSLAARRASSCLVQARLQGCAFDGDVNIIVVIVDTGSDGVDRGYSDSHGTGCVGTGSTASLAEPRLRMRRLEHFRRGTSTRTRTTTPQTTLWTT